MENEMTGVTLIMCGTVLDNLSTDRRGDHERGEDPPSEEGDSRPGTQINTVNTVAASHGGMEE